MTPKQEAILVEIRDLLKILVNPPVQTEGGTNPPPDSGHPPHP